MALTAYGLFVYVCGAIKIKSAITEYIIQCQTFLSKGPSLSACGGLSHLSKQNKNPPGTGGYILGPRIGFIRCCEPDVVIPTRPTITLSPICISSDIISVSVAVANPFE